MQSIMRPGWKSAHAQHMFRILHLFKINLIDSYYGYMTHQSGLTIAWEYCRLCTKIDRNIGHAATISLTCARYAGHCFSVSCHENYIYIRSFRIRSSTHNVVIIWCHCIEDYNDITICNFLVIFTAMSSVVSLASKTILKTCLYHWNSRQY